MDFSYSDEQNSIRELARGILDKELTRDRLKATAATADGIDGALWKTLAEANLLGVAVPEAQGGMGLGLLELCTLLEEIGRAVAPVPVLASLVLGGLPIARFGSEAQRDRWLRALATGDAILSAALVDAGSDDLARPATRARREGNAWILDGAKRLVPAASRSARVLVAATAAAKPSSSELGVGIFLVDPNAAGVVLTAQRTSTGEPLFDMTLAGVRVSNDDLLGGDAKAGAVAARWIHDCALAALCMTQVGVSERALEITTGHLKERVQFGVPIGSFQSVQHRAADCWIDLQAMRWTAWRAACRLAEDEDATRETAVAKFWAADGGSRIANTAQHLHGGLGVDVDYSLHRYFLWSKAIELSLGAATPQLVRLGRDLASTGPRELV
jgi:alkylation response protein AidB-like acyl-CoA dehydrogenase